MHQQLSLFGEAVFPPVEYSPNFFSRDEADELYAHCKKLKWEQNSIRTRKGTVLIPHLECIYGDEGCEYLYSGSVLLKAIKWTPMLLKAQRKLKEATGHWFNIVNCNLYRNGKDSIGWHSDDESIMGENPAIACISLGDERKFQMRPKGGGEITDFYLEHGSLLLMKPGCQSTWIHQLPKAPRRDGERISLTFRPHIKGAADS